MNVLALVEAPDHVCYRYRIRAFEPTFQALGGSVRVEPLAHNLFPRILQLRSTKKYEVTVVQRRLLAGWQLRILRGRARRLVFDFDDAVLYRDSNDRRGPNCPRRQQRFRAMMAVADSVIAGNAFLAQCAADHGAAPDRIHVIPTCVPTERYPAQPTPNRRQDGLDLVWIGSSSTLKGLEARADLWQTIGRRFSSLRLRMICDRFAEFPPLNVDRVNWSEATEIAELAQGHAGISWIPEDLWSQGKCGLKVLQYMAAGLPVIANPYGVHPEMILHGDTGILVQDPEEWIEAIQWLSLYPGDRAEMGRASRARAVQHYSVHAWAGRFLTALTGKSYDIQALPAPASGPEPAVTPRPNKRKDSAAAKTKEPEANSGQNKRLDPPSQDRQPAPNSIGRQQRSKKR